MKHQNLNYLIAKKYVLNFLKVLEKDNKKFNLNLNLKEIKKSYKDAIKFEDVTQIHKISDFSNDLSIKKIIEEHRSNFNLDIELAKDELNNFYKENFEGREILDVKAIKLALGKLKTTLKSCIFEFSVVDVDRLISFNELVINELDTYILKHKLGEYIDMKPIRDNILSLVEESIETLDSIKDSINEDIDSYYSEFINYFEKEVQVIIDNENNKIHTIPEWGKGLLFCLPWIIGFLVFTIYPLITTLIFSFSQVELKPSGFETEFIGFTNYINIFTKDSDFIYAITDYIVEIVIYVPLITIFSLLIALLLNTKVKGTGFFRTIFFLPVIITSGPVMKILIEQGVTSIPGLAEIINLEEISAKLPHFLQSALNVLTNEFIMILWFCGIQILVFLTGLQKIDKGVYEAANIDGASKWERFWKVTLPAINPTIVINVVFTIVMQSLFALNPIILKIQADMNDSGGIKGYGYSSAIAFTYFLVMIVLLIIFVLIFKRRDKKVRKERN